MKKIKFISLSLALALIFSVGIFVLLFAQKAFAASENKPAAIKGKEKISLVQAAILGVVEGITEYLPVSSTGHLILTGHFMGLIHYSDHVGPLGRTLDKDKMEALNSFVIVIQFGAILAVVGLYRKRVGQMCEGLVGKNRDGLHLLLLLITAFLPAAIIGLPFHKKIEQELFGPTPVAYALAVGGVLMIAVEHFFWRKNREIQRVTEVDKILFWQALVIGLAQSLSMWPGTSRSMITMLAGVVVGLDMVTAAEFSFLLALPTLSAATFLSAYEDWGVLREVAGIDGMIVGLVLSGITAAIVVKGFVKWLTGHGLTPFGIYSIIAAVVMLWFLANNS